MVKIEISGDGKFSPVGVSEIRRIIKKAAKVLGRDNFQIDVCLVKEREIIRLNKKFRGKNNPTTVLSFIQSDGFVYPKNFLNHKGEIFLNFSSIKKEAKIYNIPIKDYAIKILIHGFLHLMSFGHNNARNKAIMEKKEKEILSKIFND